MVTDPNSWSIVSPSSFTNDKKRFVTPSTFRASTTQIVKTRNVPEKGTSSASAAAEIELAGDAILEKGTSSASVDVGCGGD
jgi:hypothetical protein